MCRCGEAEQTSPHILLDCRLYTERRDPAALRVQIGADGAWELREVAASPDSSQALKSFAGWAFDDMAQAAVAE